MDKLDRMQQLHQLFSSHRHPIKLRTLAERLGCSEKNARRLIDALQDFTHRPIDYDEQHKGWAYAGPAPEGWQLPGLWLTAHELQSMATLLQVLNTFGNGLLSSELKPVSDTIHSLLKARRIDADLLSKRIRVLPIAQRALPNERLLKVADALLQQRQLQLRYTAYSRKRSVRVVSPQTLVYYRDNWYLDAWCHRSDDLRTFALARIDQAQLLDQSALSVGSDALEAHFGSSYGLFAGPALHEARLRFRASLAHEIASQIWHPQQHGEWDGDEYVLRVPYSDPRELLRDVMRYVPEVVVEGPGELREMMVQCLTEGLQGLQRP
jgi:proteasome accessory factor C